MMTTPAAMAEALARLWTKFLPDIQQRVATLEVAAQALAAGALTNEQRESAHAAAHKLAGTLGMFSLHRGTDLARQAELAFAEENTASTPDLSAWVTELRTLINRRIDKSRIDEPRIDGPAKIEE
jgi:HPt (histidine-containing phosphotransfer) domain-containing protein